MNADSETGVHIRMLCICVLVIFTISHSPNVNGQEHDLKDTLLLSINFDEDAASSHTDAHAEGIKGNGLDLKNRHDIPKLPDIGLEQFSGSEDFSVSVWVKSKSNTLEPAVILSNADFSTKPMGIYGRRRISNGFTLYSQNGAWGWNIGNGRLHYNYEPIAADQAVNHNKWHNLVFSYNAVKKEARLFYDGINRVILSLGDLDGSDFRSDLPLRIGGDNNVSPGDKTFSGVIDELQIWDCVITSEEVKKSYTEPNLRIWM